MDSDSSTCDYYVTSKSEDEEKEQRLHEMRQQEEIKQLKRERFIENERKSNRKLFNLVGLKFICFNRKKIKFAFKPSQIIEIIGKNVVFIFVMVYKNNYWQIKHGSLPVNCAKKVYSIIAPLRLKDAKIVAFLNEVYVLLVEWCRQYLKMRLEKHRKYRNNEDVYLDEEDEKFLFTQAERNERLSKLSYIYKRMMLPKGQPPRRWRLD